MRQQGISVIIIFHKRHQHLYNTIKGLENGSVLPNEVIIIEMDTEKSVLPQTKVQHNHILLETSNFRNLPIAEARNLGAFWSNYEQLAFLDVDCIPSKNYISSILNMGLEDGIIYMGLPRYMINKLESFDDSRLKKCSLIHPIRPDQDKIVKTDDYGMFWSLTFFLTHKTFSRIDGFDTAYSGYGAEDTDFAFKARALRISFFLTPFEVYHQQHPFFRPPLNSLRSIIANCNYFHKKWNIWPMQNYLKDFADRNLIKWTDHQKDAIEILSEPTPSEIAEVLVLDEPFA